MARWFRHYAGLARDEKLAAVALAAKQPIERVVWLWNVILEDAAERNEGGAFHIDLPACAWFLHCPVPDLESIMRALAASRRIAEGRVCNWPVRQFQSDHSTGRVRAHRARAQCNGEGALQ